VVVASLTVVPLLNIFNTEKNLAFHLTLLAQFVGSVATTTYQPSSYGAAALFGPTITNELQRGNGIGGLLVIAARISFKLIFPSTIAGLVASTNGFFLFANLVVVFSICCWLALLRDPDAAVKIQDYEAQRMRQLLSHNDEPTGKLEAAPISRAAGEKVKLLPLLAGGAGGSSMASVARAVAMPAAVVCSGFTVCLACFPGLTTSLVSTTLGLGDWFPVLLVLAFNAFDLVGKTLPTLVLVLTKDTLPCAALGHLLFVPVFWLVSRHPPAGGFLGFVGTDEFAFALLVSLGLCTGYLTCTAMMLGPGCVEKKDRVLAGQMMSTFLMLGLFSGSMLGLLISLS
jgi:hypothetical protein